MSLLSRYAATMRSLAFTVVLFGLAVFARCAVQAQQITNAPPTNLTVIVLDGNSGKPIKGIEPLIVVKGKLPIRLNQKTNSNGVAVFHLTDPLPEQIGISFFPDEFGECSDGMPFSTEQILKTGLVSRNICSGAKFHYSASARPGEIVIFGKRGPTLWQRILQEIP